MRNKIKDNSKITTHSKISMSQKEKKLVLILVMLIIAYFANRFLFTPRIDKLAISAGKYVTVSTRLKSLQEKNKNINNLQKQVSALEYKYEKMIKEIPPYLSEAETILILEGNASESNLHINSINFENVDKVSKSKYFSDNNNQQESTGEDKEGDNKSDSNYTSKNKNNNSNDVEGPKIIISNISLGYEGEYNSIYKFIKKLEENERKILVDEVSMNINEKNSLKGNLKLKLLSYSDSDVEIKEDLKFPENNGKFNLFSMDGSTIEGYTKSYYTPNMVLDIRNYNDNGPKYIFSEYGKTESEIYSNTGGKVEGKLKVEKLETKYRITYSLGKVSKTIERDLRIKDNTVRIDVLSHKRVNVDDNMNISLDVENKTPGTIEITVVNDDLDKPIFTLKKDAKGVGIKRVNR